MRWPRCESAPISKQRLGHDDAQVRAWQHHWIGQSFDALETLLSRDPSTGEFSHGDRPSLADIALVPQAHTAGRNGLEFGAWPTISRISDACLRRRPSRRPTPIMC